MAVSPQAKCRLSKSARRYLTDFGVSRMSTRLELPFWLRLACVPTQGIGSAKTLSFPPMAENVGESRTSIHHVEKEKEMSRCSSLFLGPSGET